MDENDSDEGRDPNIPVLYIGKFGECTLLYFRGYLYHLDKRSELSRKPYVIYRCKDRTYLFCSATLKIKKEPTVKGALELFEPVDEEDDRVGHGCQDPDPDYPAARELREELALRATKSFHDLHDIYKRTVVEKK